MPKRYEEINVNLSVGNVIIGSSARTKKLLDIQTYCVLERIRTTVDGILDLTYGLVLFTPRRQIHIDSGQLLIGCRCANPTKGQNEHIWRVAGEYKA